MSAALGSLSILSGAGHLLASQSREGSGTLMLTELVSPCACRQILGLHQLKLEAGSFFATSKYSSVMGSPPMVGELWKMSSAFDTTPHRSSLLCLGFPCLDLEGARAHVPAPSWQKSGDKQRSATPQAHHLAHDLRPRCGQQYLV